MAHTAGKWKVGKSDYGHLAVLPERHGEKLPDGCDYRPVPICRVPDGFGRDEAEALANARLIAAGPVTTASTTTATTWACRWPVPPSPRQRAADMDSPVSRWFATADRWLCRRMPQTPRQRLEEQTGLQDLLASFWELVASDRLTVMRMLQIPTEGSCNEPDCDGCNGEVEDVLRRSRMHLIRVGVKS